MIQVVIFQVENVFENVMRAHAWLYVVAFNLLLKYIHYLHNILNAVGYKFNFIHASLFPSDPRSK